MPTLSVAYLSSLLSSLEEDPPAEHELARVLSNCRLVYFDVGNGRQYLDRVRAKLRELDIPLEVYDVLSEKVWEAARDMSCGDGYGYEVRAYALHDKYLIIVAAKCDGVDSYEIVRVYDLSQCDSAS